MDEVCLKTSILMSIWVSDCFNSRLKKETMSSKINFVIRPIILFNIFYFEWIFILKSLPSSAKDEKVLNLDVF